MGRKTKSKAGTRRRGRGHNSASKTKAAAEALAKATLNTNMLVAVVSDCTEREVAAVRRTNAAAAAVSLAEGYAATNNNAKNARRLERALGKLRECKKQLSEAKEATSNAKQALDAEQARKAKMVEASAALASKAEDKAVAAATTKAAATTPEERAARRNILRARFDTRLFCDNLHKAMNGGNLLSLQRMVRVGEDVTPCVAVFMLGASISMGSPGTAKCLLYLQDLRPDPRFWKAAEMEAQSWEDVGKTTDDRTIGDNAIAKRMRLFGSKSSLDSMTRQKPQAGSMHERAVAAARVVPHSTQWDAPRAEVCNECAHTMAGFKGEQERIDCHRRVKATAEEKGVLPDVKPPASIEEKRAREAGIDPYDVLSYEGFDHAECDIIPEFICKKHGIPVGTKTVAPKKGASAHPHSGSRNHALTPIPTHVHVSADANVSSGVDVGVGMDVKEGAGAGAGAGAGSC